MNTKDQPLHGIRCSAKSLHRMRNSCAYKELQFHGVEDGPQVSPSVPIGDWLRSLGPIVMQSTYSTRPTVI